MANLKLKWGLYENLKAIDASDIGTLFVTTDEKSLYLGLTSGEKPQRLQGVVQFYEDTESFRTAVKPPYSADVIYYVASENALIRWDPQATDSEGNVVGGFIILNVPYDDIKEMSDYVNAHERALATLNTTTIPGLSNDIADIQNILLGTDEAPNSGVVKRVETLEALLGDDNEANNTILNRLSAVEQSAQQSSERWAAFDLVDYVVDSDLEEFREKFDDIDDLTDAIGQTPQEGVTEGSGILKELSDLAAADKTFGVELGKTNDAIGNLDNEIKTFINTTAPTTYQTKTEAKQQHDNLSGQMEGWSTQIGNNASAIDDLQDWKTKTADPAIAEIPGLSTRVGTLETNLTNNYYNKTEIDDAHDVLEKQINDNIKAANCLEYVGSIAAATDFNNITAAKIGATYIVTSNCSVDLDYDENTPAIDLYAGDLLVVAAKGDAKEDDNGVLSKDKITWIHIQSGYVEAHEAKLSLNDSTINLTSLNGVNTLGDRGSVTFQGADNVVLTTNEDTITVSLEWMSFDPSN